ncbi:MAG TPA: HEAT repeat domain-containing protein [Treponemataceae bacterium]|nr:HEAT repeat domain-containing protein [Treponemataceae bacterium]
MRVKPLSIFAVLILLTGGALQAEEQKEEQKTDSIMTVEEAYLSSVEGVIINELAVAEGRDSKQVALQYIENAIDSGRKGDDIQVALNSLAEEGIGSVVRENGRTMNNFPDVRAKACELLGKMGTAKAKDTLIAVMYSDNEPMVITAAVRSLGELGYNDNDEVVEMINWITRKFDIILPTSSLALEVLNTYEKIAPNVKNKSGMVEAIIRIANNYNYVTPVRNRAYEVLKKVSGNGGKNQSNKGASNSAKPADAKAN